MKWDPQESMAGHASTLSLRTSLCSAVVQSCSAGCSWQQGGLPGGRVQYVNHAPKLPRYHALAHVVFC